MPRRKVTNQEKKKRKNKVYHSKREEEMTMAQATKFLFDNLV